VPHGNGPVRGATRPRETGLRVLGAGARASTEIEPLSQPKRSGDIVSHFAWYKTSVRPACPGRESSSIVTTTPMPASQVRSPTPTCFSWAREGRLFDRGQLPAKGFGTQSRHETRVRDRRERLCQHAQRRTDGPALHSRASRDSAEVPQAHMRRAPLERNAAP